MIAAGGQLIGRFAPWVAGGLALVLAGLILFSWIRKRRSAENEQFAEPPHLAARNEIERLESMGLFEKGFFVAAIRPPTVPQGTARLRISVQCHHTKEQLDGLIKTLKDITTQSR